MNRFSIRVSCRTAHEEAFDSEWKGDVCALGEKILFREAESCTGVVVGRRRRKADAAWHRGLCVGRADDTSEHIVGTKLRVFLTRNLRRLLVEQRGAEDLVVAMEGVPWEPRQESKPGRLCRKLECVALPLPTEPLAQTPVDMLQHHENGLGQTKYQRN